LRREPMACKKVSRPSGVRTISTCGAPAAALPSFSSGSLFLLLFPCRGLRRGVLAQDVHRGLVGGQHFLGRHRREHRLIEPCLLQLRGHPGGGLVNPPGRDRHPEQHAHHERGPLRRHVPVGRQQHRGGVQHGPVAHRARVRARRRLRERHRPAARARQPGQRPLGHLPDDFHVDDLRPARLHCVRTAQPGAAAAALCRRLRGLLLIRIRVPLQAFPLVPGLPAPPAVLPPRPFRFLPPRPPRFFRPDPLLRAWRPRIRAVHRQPPLQLRQPQLNPPPQLPLGFQLAAQRRDLRVFRLHHGTQPRQQLTLLRDHLRQAGLLRHEPQACSTRTKGSNARQRRRVATP
jgi:hypothetical protein